GQLDPIRRGHAAVAPPDDLTVDLHPATLEPLLEPATRGPGIERAQPRPERHGGGRPPAPPPATAPPPPPSPPPTSVVHPVEGQAGDTTGMRRGRQARRHPFTILDRYDA